MNAMVRDRSTEIALLLLRVAVGVIFIVHGSMKLADMSATVAGFEALGIPAPRAAVYLAVLGELCGGMGLALGLLTPLAALGPVCVMVVAIAYVHAKNGLLADNNGWEYPLTMLLVALVFVVRGGGPFSLDAAIRKTKLERSHHEPIAAH